MAAPAQPTATNRGLGRMVVKTQDFEKLAELGRGAYGVVIGGKINIAAKVRGCPASVHARVAFAFSLK